MHNNKKLKNTHIKRLNVALISQVRKVIQREKKGKVAKTSVYKQTQLYFPKKRF